MPVASWFKEALHDNSLPDEKIAQLFQHYELLVRWNQKMNLTSLVPGPEMVTRHYGESLFFSKHLPVTDHSSIVDIGSGAGFPGVPIAVAHPKCKITLVESSQKKAVFLKEATRETKNLLVSARRAEEIEGRFDWIVSRAVDPHSVLSLVPQLAHRIGLMLGEDDISEVKKRADIAWLEPIRLPWGDRRFCVYGCST